MTWTKLSDDFGDECWSLSDQAFRLLVEMLNYSNRKLLDCLIPKDEMRRFAKHPDAVEELVTGGWVTDRPNGYEIVFHSLYQRSREDVLKDRAVKAANGAKGGRPRKARNLAAKQGANHGENLQGRDGTGQAFTGEGTKNEFIEVEEGVWAEAGTGEVSSSGQVVEWPVADIGQGRKAS